MVHLPVRCYPTCVSLGKVVRLGGGKGHITVAPLVADTANLSQHLHGLLTGLRLHRVTSQVRVATVTSLKLLLLPAPPLMLILDLVQRVVLVREREHTLLSKLNTDMFDLVGARQETSESHSLRRHRRSSTQLATTLLQTEVEPDTATASLALHNLTPTQQTT